MRASSPLSTLLSVLRPMFALFGSLCVHGAIAVPFVVWWLLVPPPMEFEEPGEEGLVEGPVGNDGGEVALGADVPVRVSFYEEPAPNPAAEAPQPLDPAAPARAQTAAADVKKGRADGDPDAARSTAQVAGAEGQKPRGNKAPCELIEEITHAGGTTWRVERSVLDWYAKRPKELGEQVGVTPHEGKDGKADGARIYLPRCSVLRQLGFKHADIVYAVNGRKVTNLPGAIATYLAVRDEEWVKIELARKSGERVTHRYQIVR